MLRLGYADYPDLSPYPRIEDQSEVPSTFSYPMSRRSDRKARTRRSASLSAQGDARLAQHSVTPCLLWDA